MELRNSDKRKTCLAVLVSIGGWFGLGNCNGILRGGNCKIFALIICLTDQICDENIKFKDTVSVYVAR